MPANIRPAAATRALLPILIAPHPSLKQKARPVAADEFAKVRQLAPAMLQTMYAAPGIGLAAPQLGIQLRLVVIDVPLAEGQANPLVLVNPEIIAASAETASHEEGCLSLPDQFADVVRPQAVTLTYQDEDGARHELAASGLLARCIQHEIDHLDGILFVDHISALKRGILLRRLAKAVREKAGR